MRVENVKGAVWTVDDLEFCRRRPLKVTNPSSSPSSTSPNSNSYRPSTENWSQPNLEQDTKLEEFPGPSSNQFNQTSNHSNNNYLFPHNGSSTEIENVLEDYNYDESPNNIFTRSSPIGNSESLMFPLKSENQPEFDEDEAKNRRSKANETFSSEDDQENEFDEIPTEESSEDELEDEEDQKGSNNLIDLKRSKITSEHHRRKQKRLCQSNKD